MNHRRSRLQFVAAMVAALITFSGCDWSQFRSGPDRAGYTSTQVAEFAGIPGLIEKWTGTTGGAVRSSPVIAAGTVYVGSRDAGLYAYDAATGARRWLRTTGGAIDGSPAVDANTVYVGSADTTLYALNTADGTTKWARVIDANFGDAAASPAVSGGRVFVVSAGTVRALSAADGSDAWPAPVTLTGPLSAPAVSGNLVFVEAYGSGTITALHAEDGSVAWSTTVPGTYAGCAGVTPVPAVSRTVVYAALCPVGPDAPSLFAFDTATGATVWGVGDGAYTTSPSVTNGNLYVGSASNQALEARQKTDGALLWAGPVGGALSSSPAVARNVVFVGSDDGSVRAFDANGQTNCAGTPRTCQPMWTDSTGGPVRSSPGVGDGFVYVGSDDRSLHAYGIPPVAFSKSRLVGAGVAQPTVARFGPDHRLYVGQYNGLIKVLTLARTGTNAYSVTKSETITLVQSIPNHDDDGALDPSVTTRLITGLAVGGSAAVPVVYVASSDPRVGGGTQGTITDLDTNSGVISRVTRSGSGWIKQDLVRGLPRSEESHATNALVLDSATNTLYAGQGGNTNMGAPSHNFNYLPEYAYSAAVLRVDLGAIGSSTYDLPTLTDEDHPGLTGPFGGNGGKHQAKIVASSPVQVYAPGFRNPFALVKTRAGKLLTVDNGPNAGWGNVPLKEGPAGNCTNATRDSGVHEDDSIHLLQPGYYGGHANPTRANRANTFNHTNPQSPVAVNHAIECDHRNPTNNGSLATVPGGSAGMAEYTASNLANQLAGDLLVGSVKGIVYRVTLDDTGTKVLATAPLFSNLGGSPIDVAVQSDADPQPGTIWIPNMQLNVIDVFEPSDYGGRPIPPCSGGNSLVLDEDHDGYSNADELANGTEPCSSADAPHDWDHDLVSDLRDPDDDDDGINDTADPFAIDAANGLTTDVPIEYPFRSDTTGSPCAPTPVASGCPGGLLGLGFTGLMSNGVTNYADQFDAQHMTVGGAAGVLTVDQVPPGDARDADNTQQYAFQYGVHAPDTAFTVHTEVAAPFAGMTPAGGDAMGVFVGTGDQDNYVKLVVAANGGTPEVQVVQEVGGVSTVTGVPVALADVTGVDLYLTVDKAAGTVTARVRTTTTAGPGDLTVVGPPIAVPAGWLAAATRGLAIGLIATSVGATPFPVTWSGLDATLGSPT